MITLHASTTRHDEWGGPKRYVRIYIYDSVAAFALAADAFNPDDNWTGAVGSFHPAPENSPHFTGTIRLCTEHIHTEYLTHEATHASCHVYRQDVADCISLGSGKAMKGHKNEEKLAYIVGDMTAAVMNVVFDKIGWPT